jgi:hypothetical protein
MRLRDKLLALAVFAAVMVTTSAASAQGVQLFAVLNGGNEVTNDGEAAAGDLNGFGAATVIFAGSGRICYGIVVHRISAPTAAHIHDGRAAVNGPIVIPLTVSNAGSPGAIGACISNLDNALLRKIQKTPGDFYVNVHNKQFPGGAIRGQLQ